MNKSVKLKPISARAFDNEIKALTQLYNNGVISADIHKARFDVLVKRLKKVAE